MRMRMEEIALKTQFSISADRDEAQEILGPALRREEV